MKKLQEQEKKREEQRRKREEKEARKKNLAEKIKAPDGVIKNVYINYLAFYGPKWSFYDVKAEKPLAEFKKYFGKAEYKVIWYWDIDGCGYNDYLAVEVYPKVRRGIKRGILVDELGRIKMYIDTVKGIYAPDYWILDLKLMGNKPGEVECYSIGYIPWMGKGKPPNLALGETKAGIDGLKEHEKESGNPGSNYDIGSFDIQRIDKDLNVIGSEFDDVNAAYRFTDGITEYYLARRDTSMFSLFFGHLGPTDQHKEKKKYLEVYRKAKKEGKVFAPPEKLDPKDIERALEIMTIN